MDITFVVYPYLANFANEKSTDGDRIITIIQTCMISIVGLLSTV